MLHAKLSYVLPSFKRLNRSALAVVSTLLLLFQSNFSYAKGMGVSGGLTLLEPYGARPAAMGEAFSAVSNDIAAFGYNPASLRSLSSGQASFMYQKGMAEDAFGHFMIARPYAKGSFGFSLGYYNGGSIEIFDGVNSRTVNAQTDMTLSMGYATQVGRASVGVTGKYITSQLIETARATAYAADVGLQMPVSSRIRIGGAIQNFGTKMTYLSQGDNLPRIVRGGMSLMLFPGQYKTSLLMEIPYYVNEKETRPSLGVETLVGPMALRAGYRTGKNLEEFSIGTGFVFGNSSLDYSFGLVDQLQSQHRVSYSMKFGGNSTAQMKITKAAPVTPLVLAMNTPPSSLTETSAIKEQAPKNQVYVIRRGDTLAKIAKVQYGDAKLWTKIYAANDHLLNSDSDIEVGQRIVIPH